MSQKISIIVPCYNEEESIPVFYEKTSKILEGMDVDYEICFVNDGSGDGTTNGASDGEDGEGDGTTNGAEISVRKRHCMRAFAT